MSEDGKDTKAHVCTIVVVIMQTYMYIIVSYTINVSHSLLDRCLREDIYNNPTTEIRLGYF